MNFTKSRKPSSKNLLKKTLSKKVLNIKSPSLKRNFSNLKTDNTSRLVQLEKDRAKLASDIRNLKKICDNKIIKVHKMSIIK